MRPTAPLPLALLLALSACGGTTGPSLPLAGTYVLARVDGAGEPLVIARRDLASGERQLYLLTYDTLGFTADTVGTRKFELRVETLRGTQPTLPPLRTPFAYTTSVRRRGDRVVVRYASAGGPALAPDTFTVRGTDLLRQGPFGVVCDGCPPPRRVEYVYELR